MSDFTNYQKMAIKSDTTQDIFRKDLKANGNRSTRFHKIIDCLTGEVFSSDFLSHLDEETSTLMFYKHGSKKIELKKGPSLKNARLVPTIKELKSIYFEHATDADFLVRLGLYIKDKNPMAMGITELEELALQFCEIWKNKKSWNGKKWVTAE